MAQNRGWSLSIYIFFSLFFLFSRATYVYVRWRDQILLDCCFSFPFFVVIINRNKTKEEEGDDFGNMSWIIWRHVRNPSSGARFETCQLNGPGSSQVISSAIENQGNKTSTNDGKY